MEVAQPLEVEGPVGSTLLSCVPCGLHPHSVKARTRMHLLGVWWVLNLVMHAYSDLPARLSAHQLFSGRE